jgi:hypothetical protein
MANTGWTTPGNTADMGGGTAARNDWQDTDNIKTADTSYASNASTTENDDISNFLAGTNFGFAIPAGSTIDGIMVRMRVDVDDADNVRDETIKIIKNGTILGDNYSASAQWEGLPTYHTFGSSTALWGLGTPTAADINNVNFGFAIQYEQTERSDIPPGNSKVDVFEMDIYYTEPEGTGFQVNIGDSWKSVDGMQINIGDSWKAVAGAQVNIGDTWKTIF